MVRQLLNYLDKLESKYGRLPSILDTRADFSKDSSFSASLYKEAYAASLELGDNKNLSLVSSSLAEIYATEIKDFAKGKVWFELFKAHQHNYSDEDLDGLAKELAAILYEGADTFYGCPMLLVKRGVMTLITVNEPKVFFDELGGSHDASITAFSWNKENQVLSIGIDDLNSNSLDFPEYKGLRPVEIVFTGVKNLKCEMLITSLSFAIYDFLIEEETCYSAHIGCSPQPRSTAGNSPWSPGFNTGATIE